MKTLTRENELDPRSEASMWLISLRRQLARFERLAHYCHKPRQQARAAQSASALRAQIDTYKQLHRIA